MPSLEPESIDTEKPETETVQPVLESPAETQIAYENELARKLIHVCSISIPIIYYHISQELALLLLAPMFLGFFAVDLLKMFVKPLARWYYRTFGSMLRTHELDEARHNFNGATYVTLAALLSVWFFPKMITIAVFSILILSDTAAALIGRKFGKHKIASKTLEGSIAFFAVAVLVVLQTPKLNFGIGVATAVVATLVELYPVKIFGFALDDNLTIPLVAGAFALLCYIFFLPQELAYISVR